MPILQMVVQLTKSIMTIHPHATDIVNKTIDPMNSGALCCRPCHTNLGSVPVILPQNEIGNKIQSLVELIWWELISWKVDFVGVVLIYRHVEVRGEFILFTNSEGNEDTTCDIIAHVSKNFLHWCKLQLCGQDL